MPVLWKTGHAVLWKIGHEATTKYRCPRRCDDTLSYIQHGSERWAHLGNCDSVVALSSVIRSIIVEERRVTCRTYVYGEEHCVRRPLLYRLI